MLTEQEIAKIRKNVEDIDFDDPFKNIMLDATNPMPVVTAQGYYISFARCVYKGITLFESLLVTRENAGVVDSADTDTIAKEVLVDGFQQSHTRLTDASHAAHYIKINEELKPKTRLS